MYAITNSTCDICCLNDSPVDAGLLQNRLVLVLGTSVITTAALKAFEFYRNFRLKPFLNGCLKFTIKLPVIRGFVDRELNKEKAKLAEEIAKRERPKPHFRKLPVESIDPAEIIDIFTRREAAVPSPVKTFKQTGAVYHDEELLLKIQAEVAALTQRGNPLHPGCMDHYLDMEAEVVSMTADMFDGDGDVCGNMTMGGTLSNFHAIWAYYNRAKDLGIKKPNLVIPSTAHASFDKACEVLGIDLVKVPADSNYQVDLKAMETLINSNTIAIVGTAGTFSHGVMDDIEALSETALAKNVPLHVDCCMGSFMAPLLKKEGRNLPQFGFDLEGVTSISADPHKYGFTPKGASVVMYRNKELHQYQMFTYPKWDGGIYATPTLPGSRPGMLIAMAWATMLCMGRKKYVEAYNEIAALREDLQRAISGIDELEVMGDPKLAIVAFRSKPGTFHIFNLHEKLKKRGWGFATLQNPDALHFDFTLVHARREEFRDIFEKDLRECVDELMTEKGSQKAMSGTAKLYGTVQKIPKLFADILAREFWSLTYAMRR